MQKSEMMGMAENKGHENLISFTELTEEEHREIASKGGKASIKARRKNSYMRR